MNVDSDDLLLYEVQYQSQCGHEIRNTNLYNVERASARTMKRLNNVFLEEI